MALTNAPGQATDRPPPPPGARNLAVVVLDSLRYDSGLEAKARSLGFLGEAEPARAVSSHEQHAASAARTSPTGSRPMLALGTHPAKISGFPAGLVSRPMVAEGEC